MASARPDANSKNPASTQNRAACGKRRPDQKSVSGGEAHGAGHPNRVRSPRNRMAPTADADPASIRVERPGRPHPNHRGGSQSPAGFPSWPDQRDCRTGGGPTRAGIAGPALPDIPRPHRKTRMPRFSVAAAMLRPSGLHATAQRCFHGNRAILPPGQ